MPFTPSHIIAVLPFRRFSGKYLSMTGLIAGSVSPDFEFFLRVTLYGNISHTWLGFFVFDFPVAVLIGVVYHMIVKKPFIMHTPSVLYKRWGKYAAQNWFAYLKGHKLIFILSCFLGILTHFLWDNLTHHPGYISDFHFDFSLNKILVFGKLMPLYDLFQIVSSLMGLVILAIFIWKSDEWGVESPTSQKEKYVYWIWVFVFTLFIIGIRYAIGIPDEKPFGQFVVISISAFMQSLIILGLYHLNRRKIEKSY